MKTLSNTTQLIGNLGKDSKVIDLDSGKAMVVFSIATSDSYTDESGQKQSNTEWHNCVLFRESNETGKKSAKYLVKGTRIALEGKLSHRKSAIMVGPQKDIEVSVINTTIVVNEFLLLGSKEAGGSEV